MAKIKGGKVKSLAGLKSSLKKGSGGSQYLSRVPADDVLTVRFLTEPDGWHNYFEHYDAMRKYYPCTETDCPGCDEGDRPSQRWLANALDVAETKVIPLVLPKSLAGSVYKKYEKYATLLDRDYDLSREGSGFDTEYDATPDSPSKMNVRRFDLIDLAELLQQQLDMAEQAEAGDDDDDDEDEVPVSKRGTPASRRRAAAKSKVDDDDDDDDADDDDAEDEGADDDQYTRDDLLGMTLAELKALAKEVGFTVADLRGMDKDAIADAVLALYDEADESDEDEADEDADDEEELDEDALNAMSLAELKTLAKELGIRVKAGTAKDDVIELILDAAGEEDDENEPPF